MAVSIAEKTASKSHFSGRALADIQLNCEIFLCTIRPNIIEAVKAPGKAESVEFNSTTESPGLITIIERKKAEAEKIDLTEAPVVVSGGRAITSADHLEMLQECAASLGGAVGASRALVDEGNAPHSIQVGQTGKTVSPKLYLACGISGAVQHFAGIKSSKVIVAINSDKDAPIFSKCDYGIVGDIFEVVPKLTQQLKS